MNSVPVLGGPKHVFAAITLRNTMLIVLLLAILFVFQNYTSQAQAGEAHVNVAGLRLNVPVVSVRQQRWAGVIRQERDFSCGAAAVATLLTHHYQSPISESVVFDEMWAVGEQDKIREQGFSLLDMQKFLQARGYDANGYQVTLDQLAQAGVPAIVLINVRGYEHFVVVKGIRKKEVLIGDSAMGMRRMDREHFQRAVASDIFFVIANKLELAQTAYDQQEEWSRVPAAPLANAVPRNALPGSSLLLRSAGRF